MSKTNQDTLDAYNKRIEKYIETSPQKVDGHLKKWIDKNLAMVSKSARILELGSGSGKDADYFESQGYTMELTDGSQGFVDHLNASGKQARVLNALTDNLGSDYGMVFSDAVFLHFTREELKGLLKKIHAALKDGGRLVFSTKAGEGEEITDRKLDATRYFCFWLPDDITAALKEAGFTNIEIEVIDDYRGKARPDWLLIDATKPKK